MGMIRIFTFLSITLVCISIMSCSSWSQITGQDADFTLPKEVLTGRLAQSADTVYFQCQDHVLAIYNGSLYRKHGANSYELLSPEIKYGSYQWTVNESLNEFNPATRIELIESQNQNLTNRLECTALNFYDRERIYRATTRYHSSTKSRMTDNIGEEEADRRTEFKPKPKPRPKPKPPAPAKKPVVAEPTEKLEINLNKIPSPAVPKEKEIVVPDSGQKPKPADVKPGEPTKDAAKEKTAPEAEPAGHNPTTQTNSDGEKKTETPASAEPDQAKPKQTDEHPGFFARLLKKIGIK